MWNSFHPNHGEFADHQHVIPFRFPAQFNSDEFRMYCFKIKRCPKQRSHDWTRCPFAHQGERAARRDPRRFYYCGVPCPEFRTTGACARGENCLFAHGVFELWLHPERYRTQLCTAGLDCQRQVCFFAHTLRELRAEEPPVFKHNFKQQRWLEIPTDVIGKWLLSTRAGAPSEVEFTGKGLFSTPLGATSSEVVPPPIPVNAVNTFSGGTDFLASLSGITAKEGDDMTRNIFGRCADEYDAPNIGWVEEVVAE